MAKGQRKAFGDRSTLRQLARAAVPEVVVRLQAIAKSSTNESAAVRACEILMDRGYGKASTDESAALMSEQIEKLKLENEQLRAKIKPEGEGVTQEDQAVAAAMKDLFGEAQIYPSSRPEGTPPN